MIPSPSLPSTTPATAGTRDTPTAGRTLPRPLAAFYRQFGHPDGGLGALAGLVMARRNRDVNAWAVDLLGLQTGDHVLDVGCGPGVAVAAAARISAGRVTGVDPSAVMVAQARRRNRRAIAGGRVDVLEAGAEALPVSAATVDAATAVNSLAHWASRDLALSELARVLRPGARLALVLRIRDDTAGALSRAAYGFPAARLEELEHALAAAGLEPTGRHTYYDGHETSLALLARRGTR